MGYAFTDITCSAEDSMLLAAAARDFCPFPDYRPNPLDKMLSANSSDLLSEHYAAVQASLTPQQRQDFTRSLRSTFGKEGKVSYGGMGVVALSLAVLFDTVARQVKGEYVSDQEPIPGLFLKEPSGDYPPQVYLISKYLRLVPHIVNNPTKMIDKTEKYLLELKRAAENYDTTQQTEDITVLNLLRCYIIGEHMLVLLKSISDNNVVMKFAFPNGMDRKHLNFNCDRNVTNERLLVGLLSLGDRTKEAFKNCEHLMSEEKKTAIENIIWMDFLLSFSRFSPLDTRNQVRPQGYFDLKAKALATWI